MKYEKFVVPVSVSAAVVIAAVAAVVVTNNRAAVARAKAAEAESLEIAADRNAKEAKAVEAAAIARANTAAAEKAKSEAERNIKVAEAEKSKADVAAEKLAVERAKLAAEAERSRAAAEAAKLAAEQARDSAARAELEKENARIAAEFALSNAAVAEATAKLEAEKRKSEAIIAEATALRLRKIDFDRLESELLEYKQYLDERERALHPDVSIYDSSNVTWVAEREADVIGAETNRLARPQPVRPEDDVRLSAAARGLAKAERLEYTASTNRAAVSRAKIVASLERLRESALNEGRVGDAEFYLKSIKSFYPDYHRK